MTSAYPGAVCYKHVNSTSGPFRCNPSRKPGTATARCYARPGRADPGTATAVTTCVHRQPRQTPCSRSILPMLPRTPRTPSNSTLRAAQGLLYQFMLHRPIILCCSYPCWPPRHHQCTGTAPPLQQGHFNSLDAAVGAPERQQQGSTKDPSPPPPHTQTSLIHAQRQGTTVCMLQP
jgi:hypothetical protein